ncbi:type II secretion system F family protein [Patescibacteria group bacterium]|nr:type II secretion system F family protein [Patescibacteria group bacterium]
MPLEETKQNTSQAKQTQKSTESNPAFDALEKKFLYPEGINQKFDLLVDHIRSVPNEEKIFFTQNLSVMLKSGLSASRAFRTLTLQANNPKFKRALIQITRSVEKGKQISESMKLFPKIFSSIFISMIEAGEISGQLENVLKELTEQLKRSYELKNKIKGALMYPMAILIAMTVIGTGMIVFVIPKLTSIFSEMDAELPLPTKILISVSTTVNSYIFIFAPAVIVLIGLLIYLTRKGLGQKIWHKIILSFPVINKISVKINLAKISRTLSSLLATDMPIVKSLELTSNVVKNAYYRDSLIIMSKQVEQGVTISSQMPQFGKIYPPVVQQMIQVGEETGEISNILNQLAEFYEEDVSTTMESLPSLIEPILIVILGSAVGGMAIAVIMPMFSLSSAI